MIPRFSIRGTRNSGTKSCTPPWTSTKDQELDFSQRIKNNDFQIRVENSTSKCNWDRIKVNSILKLNSSFKFLCSEWKKWKEWEPTVWFRRGGSRWLPLSIFFFVPSIQLCYVLLFFNFVAYLMNCCEDNWGVMVDWRVWIIVKREECFLFWVEVRERWIKLMKVKNGFSLMNESFLYAMLFF